LCAAHSTAWRSFAQATGETESGLHDDFKPQIKASPSVSAKEQIEQDVKKNKVFVYMKVSPRRSGRLVVYCQLGGLQRYFVVTLTAL
jgi:hypothetical protein